MRSLRGKLIVFTGTLEIERATLRNQAERQGAKVVNAISSRTDFLVKGVRPGRRKMRDATTHGVEIIDEQQFSSMLRFKGGSKDKKPANNKPKMRFSIFGLAVEGPAPIVLLILALTLLFAAFWYWPEIMERLSGT